MQQDLGEFSSQNFTHFASKVRMFIVVGLLYIIHMTPLPSQDAWLIYIKIFSQEDFALWSKLWPNNFSEHRPIFAGNSRLTGISQLGAGKTRSKRPHSHCLSTGHLLANMWASFHPLDPSLYLSSFSSWRPKSKKFPFFTNFHSPLVTGFFWLCRAGLWMHPYSSLESCE